MEIGKKLKNARIKSNLTQEQVAEKVLVSRQTISNWENEKSYPDIISVIKLSDLYSMSLDDLLKGDKKMIEHLEESTNIVKSNRKLVVAVIVNIVLFLSLLIIAGSMPQTIYVLASIFCLAVISVAFLLYEIVKKI
ncbi:helix-turn-helix domain-containing protein [Clostridium nigeriense]|uniref:helix-turn-helix domain-containing protein n=1 Tax=Clostridium nigeriense TaxID=1805470 RepID=UPI003D338A86